MKILRLKAVIEATGLSRSLIYKLIKQGAFPKSFRLTVSGRAVGWSAEEVDAWISARIEARCEGKSAA
jgi:prophage regulatory protein